MRIVTACVIDLFWLVVVGAAEKIKKSFVTHTHTVELSVTGLLYHCECQEEVTGHHQTGVKGGITELQDQLTERSTRKTVSIELELR